MGNVPRTSHLQWDSGMSPHKYDLIEKSANVANCCEYFKVIFHCAIVSLPRHNTIAKHADWQIRGKPPAYYHPIKGHIKRKHFRCIGHFYVKLQVTTTACRTKLCQHDCSWQQLSFYDIWRGFVSRFYKIVWFWLFENQCIGISASVLASALQKCLKSYSNFQKPSSISVSKIIVSKNIYNFHVKHLW